MKFRNRSSLADFTIFRLLRTFFTLNLPGAIELLRVEHHQFAERKNSSRQCPRALGDFGYTVSILFCFSAGLVDRFHLPPLSTGVGTDPLTHTRIASIICYYVW